MDKKSRLLVLVVAAIGSAHVGHGAQEQINFLGKVKSMLFGTVSPIRPTAPDELHVGLFEIRDDIDSALDSLQLLHNLAENDDIHAILIYCNAHGGSGAGAHQIAALLEHAATQKPVVAYIEYCLSAAYIITCTADVIVANPLASIGSIGVSTDIPIPQDRITLGMGRLKKPAIGADGRIDASYRASHEARMKMLYHQLCTYIAAQRGLLLEEILKQESATYAATEAQQRGLVDIVGDLFDALAICRDLVEQRGEHHVGQRNKIRLSGRDKDISYLLPDRSKKTQPPV